MKDFLVTDYVFSPGASTAGYVDFINMPDFDITRVVSIVNQTRGVIIYATASADKKYSSVSGNRVFLNFDTSSHSASDKLQVVYNSSKALKTQDTDQQELTRLLNRLVKVMENQQACDSSQRQRVTIDAGTLPTVTTVGTVSTVTTVSTVSSITAGTITNTQQIAGMNQEQYINIARNAYANSIRNRLFFS
ncbi:MAG: hypothetical protein ACK6DA_16250 [Candidatus Kapaibacterium sp.]|jgi:hypothetical protein